MAEADRSLWVELGQLGQQRRAQVADVQQVVLRAPEAAVQHDRDRVRPWSGWQPQIAKLLRPAPIRDAPVGRRRWPIEDLALVGELRVHGLSWWQHTCSLSLWERAGVRAGVRAGLRATPRARSPRPGGPRRAPRPGGRSGG